MKLMSGGIQSAKYAGAISVVLLTATAFAASPVRKDLHYKVGKHPMIAVSNPYGTIVVKAGAARQVTLTAFMHSDRVQLDESENGSRIVLVSQLLPGADGNAGAVDYELSVPPESNLTLHSGSGSIHVEKLTGDVIMEGGTGPMEIVDCANGHVHVRTLNGTVKLNNVHNGHVEVFSMAGNIALTSVDGPFVKVNSNSGSIQYDGDFSGGGIYDFDSYTGPIEALAPPYASIEVNARSSGSVQSDFSLEPKHTALRTKVGNALVGTWGKAASSVNLFSFSGKIHLKKRQN